jgi:hypothetical protein
VHIWCYDDAADRAQAGMTVDPDWQNYLRSNTEAGNLLEQRT